MKFDNCFRSGGEIIKFPCKSMVFLENQDISLNLHGLVSVSLGPVSLVSHKHPQPLTSALTSSIRLVSAHVAHKIHPAVEVTFHDFHRFFIDFHDFMRHFLLQIHWYLDRKLWISMKHRQLRQVTAPSSGGLEQCRDIILIRTRGDTSIAGALIRSESPDARVFSRDIQKYFGFGQSRTMQRPTLRNT